MILPDLLRPGLRVVFCGTAAGTASALTGGYAGRGNRFWNILHETGLTPWRLRPEQCNELLEFAIGLTDVCKTQHGMDHQVAPSAFDPDRLESAVARTHPATLAFNGKAAARIALRLPSRAPLPYGPLDRPLAGAATWVLPSTSGAASGGWDPAPWSALAASCRLPPPESPATASSGAAVGFPNLPAMGSNT